MTRYIIGNLRTGRRILDLPVMSGRWGCRYLTAGTINVTVDLNDPDVQALELSNTATPTQAFLAVVEGETIMEAGPIWVSNYSRDTRTLELAAKGMGSYFNHRLILPLLAATVDVDQFTIPDPTDTSKTMANPALTSSYSALSLGTIAKRLVEQAQSWAGSDVPIVFQADEAGTHERNYLGLDFKPVMQAIDDIANTEDGPEFSFQPRFTADMLGVEWLFRTGTNDNPLVTSESVPLWSVTAPKSPVSGLTISEDGSQRLSLGWQVGGRQADTVLVARAYDPTLVDSGFPLMEDIDSSHSTVSEQSTLDSYAAAMVRAGLSPYEVWSFTAEANPVDENGLSGGPQIGQYRVGDFADLVFDAWDPLTGVGDPFLTQKRTVRHRIIGLSGDERGRFVKVDLAPKVGT
tara:strand:+ start:1916 stop:3130 length:1215 start_codon:yes stop_codon:yes gene_type:complete